MSVVGTSIASSVAQSPVQTQQVAGQRDRADAESAGESRDIRDLFQAHVESLQEDQRDEDAPTNLHVDKRLSEGHADAGPGKQKARKRQTQPAAAEPAGPLPVAGAPAPAPNASTDSPLYRHLDVKG